MTVAAGVLLRVAAFAIAVFELGHTLGGMVLGKSRGPNEDALMASLGDHVRERLNQRHSPRASRELSAEMTRSIGIVHRRCRSIRTMPDCSCTCSTTISRPSGEMSKSRTVNSGPKLVN